MVQELIQHQPAGNPCASKEAQHPDRSKEVQRPREITQKKADRDQIEKDTESARNAVMRGAPLPIDVANGNLADGRAVPGSQGWNEPVQFTVKRNLLQNLATIGLERRSKVVDIDSAQFGHHPVGAAGRDAAQPQIIDPALPPAADDVIPLGDFLQKYGNIRRIVLQVTIHGDDVLTAGMIESCGQGGCLAEVTGQANNGHAAIYGSDFAQQREGAVAGAVVNKDDLEAAVISFHDCLELVVKIRDIILLIMQGYNDGIFEHEFFIIPGTQVRLQKSSPAKPLGVTKRTTGTHDILSCVSTTINSRMCATCHGGGVPIM